MSLGKCYLCVLQTPTPEQLEDPNFPREAVLLVKGTGVCLEHVRCIANADLVSRFPE